jgi:Ca2+-binding RTX toxin-like protein
VEYNNITGGSGGDTFIMGAQLNTSDFNGTTEQLDGGDGVDVLQASFGADYGPALPLVGIEEVRFNTTGNFQVNMTGVTGIDTITIEEDGAAQTLTLLGVSSTELPALNFRGDNAQTAQTYDAVNYISNTSAGSDTLAITVGNRGTPLNLTGTANVHTIGAALTANTIEIVTLTVEDGPAVFNNILSDTMKQFTATASSNLTVGALEGGANTVQTINASAVAGNFVGTCNDMLAGGTVTLGAGNDDFSVAGSAGTNISINGGAGNDTLTGSDQNDLINAGAGTDTLIGGQGQDSMSGGSEKDTFRFAAANHVTAGTPDTVNDFAQGANNDVLSFDATAFGINAGALDEVIDNFQVTTGVAPDPIHDNDSEVNVITTAVAGALTALNAAAAIADADAAYAIGDTKLFIVSNNVDAAVFLFVSDAADATVVEAELDAGSGTPGPIITLSGINSAELAALVVGNFEFAD